MKFSIWHKLNMGLIVVLGAIIRLEGAEILSLATAVPDYSAEQGAIAQKIISLLKLEGEIADFITKVYGRTAIKRRYSVLEDITTQDPEKQKLFTPEFFEDTPKSGIRNELYVQEAPKLALKAAREVMRKWGRSPEDITHLISVSCTGVMAPGIEFILQKELGLRPETQRIGINFMGCFGAFRGLSVASSIARENPKNRVLLVCTELCSLHLQADARPDILIANALFADGSAAAIIGGNPTYEEKPLWSITRSESHALANSQEEMTWSLSDHGCVMTLSSRVPKIIEEQSPVFINRLMQNADYASHTWAVHPGGKSILQAIERTCNLKAEQTAASWHVLENYGNMSSATFLFVLDTLAQDIEKHKKVVGLGFGPGLSIEGIILTGKDA